MYVLSLTHISVWSFTVCMVHTNTRGDVQISSLFSCTIWLFTNVTGLYADSRLPSTACLAIKRRVRDASWLAPVKCRGCARRRFTEVKRTSTCLTLKRVVTSIILLEWDVCARIPDTWLALANLHRVHAACQITTIVNSLYDAHELKAHRTYHVCLSAPPFACLFAWFNSRTIIRISMKFGMDVRPLRSTQIWHF
jgi:hypothetical protein